MKTTPYWQDTAETPQYPSLQEDLTVDVVVIGGGITGITAAYLLQKAGAKVALLERDRFTGGETGHTTAHLTYVTDLRLTELVAKFGRDHARAAWDAGLAAIHRIHDTVEEEELDCEFRWVPGYLHRSPADAPEGEKTSLENDAAVARELGFEAAFLDKVPFIGEPGVRFANQAKFHPTKYLSGLLKTIRGGGCSVFEQTEVTEVQTEPLAVKANHHVIRCEYIVIATHVPLQGATGSLSAALFQTKIMPYTTYAVGAQIPQGLVAEASLWDTADPYFYLRIDRKETHDYAILGGADHKTGQTRDPEQHYATVTKRLLELFPQAKVDHRWSGQVVETVDGLPFMGETAPRQFVATGFSGNGTTFGTLAAVMACDAVTGRTNPWSQLFDIHRKKLSGIWDYLKENKDYPYYLLKDQLAKATATSLEAVERGEGKYVVVDGEKLAVYRDEKGKLTVRSAVCTHMGCLVRWNEPEKSWDCPCHGSRFTATGEVMGGPAETPLAEVKH
jgi:glycine/D-amino acid oxidase-like deaminating enzyme/nitrite reductase/ring-hydroxylating ferredoxin subunit